MRRRVMQAGWLSGVVLMLVGCGGYESNFGCKGYPDEPLCKSVSNVYADRFAPSRPLIDEHKKEQSTSANASPTQDSAAALSQNPAIAGKAESYLGKPILKAPRSFQAWVSPWRDAKGRLHEASVVYVAPDGGEFLYGHQTGKFSGVRGSSRELYPRKGRMVEDISKKGPTASSSSSGSTSGSGSGNKPGSSAGFDDLFTPGAPSLTPSSPPSGFVPPGFPQPGSGPALGGAPGGPYLTDGVPALGGSMFP